MCVCSSLLQEKIQAVFDEWKVLDKELSNIAEVRLVSRALVPGSLATQLCSM